MVVGKSTDETLSAWGIPALRAAPPFNSEAVLAMLQFIILLLNIQSLFSRS
jgi:hypothetical protein